MPKRVFVVDRKTKKVLKTISVKNMYIWWIGDKNGQIGSWPSEAKAQKAIEEGLKSGLLNPNREWKPIRHEVALCPSCGELREADIIEGLGECLECDHIRGDLMYG